jgi:hypothetical protein
MTKYPAFGRRLKEVVLESSSAGSEPYFVLLVEIPRLKNSEPVEVFIPVVDVTPSIRLPFFSCVCGEALEAKRHKTAIRRRSFFIVLPVKICLLFSFSAYTPYSLKDFQGLLISDMT